MMRDPFYRKIIERLQGSLDPELFEQCAADLLREIYPLLVPIQGGDDAGMDGAIADGINQPFPLISTTGKKVIGNLTRNLNSYLDRGGPRRKAVLATSQKLTKRRRDNLHDRAKELGFQLIQIHDQTAMANLLYCSPEWCRELLDLSGDPAPLSIIPRTARPLLSQEILGRERELEWLRRISDDSLLVGQPGSGKTFLLHKFAMEGEALFVTSKDRGEIAAGLRAQQPKILIVDDAHIARELLLDLKQLREETGADFSILATCWPGAKDDISDALNLPQSRIYYLDRLTQDEIAEVVRVTGVSGPDVLIQEIVNQAEGRPGLAVTLVHLCLQGAMQQVTAGDGLSRSILSFFTPIFGDRAQSVLAGLSIGGSAGMLMSGIVTALGINLVQMRETVTTLAAAGIVYEIDRFRLSVRPAALRHVLIRDVFFGPMSLPIEPFLKQAPRLSCVAQELIGAKFRGAAIPDRLLVAILEESSAPPWREYAWLGEGEASYVLNHHPEQLISVAKPFLHWIPMTALPRLLEAAVGDNRPLHSNTDHPLRIIDDWVHDAYPGTGAAIERRRSLFRAACEWLGNEGDIKVALAGLSSTFSPEFSIARTEPGSGNTLTMRSGYLSLDELHAIQELWSGAARMLKTIEIVDWEPLQRIVEEWAYSRQAGVVLPDEVYQFKRDFAVQLLLDITDLAKGRLGVLRWVRRIAAVLDLELVVQIDEDFKILYPNENLERDWRAVQEEQTIEVRRLTNRWLQFEPTKVANRLAEIEQEASLISRRWPRWTPLLCQEIADQIEDPIEWASAMMAAGVTGDLVYPFLQRAVEVEQAGWERHVEDCLEEPSLRGAAIQLVLTLSDPPETLIVKAFVLLDEYHGLVETLCLRHEVPELRVQQLLQHENLLVARAAAHGEWGSEPKGVVRESLQEDWRRIVINHARTEYWVREAVKSDSELAYAWLLARIKDSSSIPNFYPTESPFQVAAQALSLDERHSLLGQVSPNVVPELIAHLIGRQPELYKELLANQSLEDFHLVPLSGAPDEAWIGMARAASAAGYTPKEIALSAFSITGVVMERGPESRRWSGWEREFEPLSLHTDDLVKEIGEVGKAYATSQRLRAERQERSEAIYGWE